MTKPEVTTQEWVTDTTTTRSMATGHVSDSSSSGDDDFFRESTILPYRFEPTYSKEELEVRQEERGRRETTVSGLSEGESSVDRTKDRFWCTCGKCVLMPTDVECVCCHEVQEAHRMVDSFDLDPQSTDSSDVQAERIQKCITQHPDFAAHLNRGVLDTYFRSHKYNWRKFPKPRGPGGTLNNAQFRLVAYRFILDWMLQGRALGKKNRIPLPACVVCVIRQKYPADDNEYRGFEYAELPTV